MTLRDIPIVGSTLGLGVDLLLTGGDTIAALGLVLVESIDLWIPLLSNLQRLADMTSLIPEAPIESLLIGGSIIFVAYYGARIVRQLYTRITDK